MTARSLHFCILADEHREKGIEINRERDRKGANTLPKGEITWALRGLGLTYKDDKMTFLAEGCHVESQVLFWSRFPAIRSLGLGWQARRISAPGISENWGCKAKSPEMIFNQRWRSGTWSGIICIFFLIFYTQPGGCGGQGRGGGRIKLWKPRAFSFQVLSHWHCAS